MSKGKVNYSDQTHEDAFNLWYETRNVKGVGRHLQIAEPTLWRWYKEDFPCHHGCPYHGWEKLAEERETKMQAKLKMINDNNYNPMEHSAAMDAAVASSESQPLEVDKKMAMLSLIRTDVERLVHMELLYNMIFFQLTGIPLDYKGGSALPSGKQIDLQDVYDQALKVKGMEGGIRCLNQVMDRMDVLKTSAGIKRVEEAKLQKQLSGTEDEKEDNKPISLSEIRVLKERMERMKPEDLSLLRHISNREDEVVEAVANNARSA